MSDPHEDFSDPHFVWLRGQRGPRRQIWYELYYGENNHLKPYVLAVHRLAPGEDQLSMDELARRYPPPPPPYDGDF
jgi:hypothetical protein